METKFGKSENMTAHRLNATDLARVSGLRRAMIDHWMRTGLLHAEPGLDGKRPMFSETEITVAQIMAPLAIARTIVPVMALIAQAVRIALEGEGVLADIRAGILAARAGDPVWLLITMSHDENRDLNAVLNCCTPQDFCFGVSQEAQNVGAFGTVQVINLTEALKGQGNANDPSEAIV